MTKQERFKKKFNLNSEYYESLLARLETDGEKFVCGEWEDIQIVCWCLREKLIRKK